MAKPAKRVLVLGFWAGLFAGCVEVPVPPAPAAAATLSFEAAPDGGARRVTRLRVHAPSGAPLDAGAFTLFSGALNDYALSRIKKHDLPSTLLERQVPVVAYHGDDGDLLVAPSRVLDTGASYSLVASDSGWVREFTVSREATPLLERVWPPKGSPSGEFWLGCGVDAAGPLEVVLEPRGEHVVLEPRAIENLNGDAVATTCFGVHLGQSVAAGAPILLPASAGNFAIDPEPLLVAIPSAPLPASCRGGEASFGPGCALVDDDRVRGRSAGEPLLWLTRTLDHPRLDAVLPGAEFVLRGLAPDADTVIAAEVVSLSGAELAVELPLHTLPAHAHWVLNEVLANPLGPEPQDEWVELVNDGAAPAELGGLRLEDVGGVTPLPALGAAPGEFVIVRRTDYSGLYDVPSAPGARVASVPELGKNGLTNGGEQLLLTDAAGAALSRFPPLSGSHAGVSVARRRLDSSDGDPSAFGEHADPGASPGAPNRLAE